MALDSWDDAAMKRAADYVQHARTSTDEMFNKITSLVP